MVLINIQINNTFINVYFNDKHIASDMSGVDPLCCLLGKSEY